MTIVPHTRTIRYILVLLLILAGMAGGDAARLLAQSNSFFNQRDDEYRLLGLKRAKEAYDFARREFERNQELYRQQLIPQADLERARSLLADAEVNYQQSLLAVLFETQYVSVVRAVKYQDPAGNKRVRLTLANTSGGGEEFRKLLNIEDELFRSLQPDVINYVYVALMNEEGAIVSQPYEAKIDQLVFGQPKELDFTLLQDLDAVTVNIVYGNGTSRTMKIFLQKDASVDKVIVQSEQFSQEAELGETASFDLQLELFSGTRNTFFLDVVNLPEQINRFFQDPESQARLTQIRFTESTHTRRALLQVSLPDRPTAAVPMDQSIPFYVLLVPADQPDLIRRADGHEWSLEEIRRLNVGYVRLELVPRGKGRLLIRAPQLYQSITGPAPVTMSLDVVNEGTRRLDNVEIRAEPPFNWRKDIQPPVIPKLDIGQEQRVELRFTPPADIAVGRYEIRVRTSALSDNQPVNADDKILVVEVKAETDIQATAIIVGLIVTLVLGIVVVGIRLARR